MWRKIKMDGYEKIEINLKRNLSEKEWPYPTKLAPPLME